MHDLLIALPPWQTKFSKPFLVHGESMLEILLRTQEAEEAALNAGVGGKRKQPPSRGVTPTPSSASTSTSRGVTPTPTTGRARGVTPTPTPTTGTGMVRSRSTSQSTVGTGTGTGTKRMRLDSSASTTTTTTSAAGYAALTNAYVPFLSPFSPLFLCFSFLILCARVGPTASPPPPPPRLQINSDSQLNEPYPSPYRNLERGIMRWGMGGYLRLLMLRGLRDRGEGRGRVLGLGLVVRVRVEG